MIYRDSCSKFFWAPFLALLFLFTQPGCRLFPPLPPADLSQGDWQSQSGQAVWVRGEQLELAGEVLVSKGSGRSIVQFSKGPILIIQARVEGSRWEIQFPPQNRRYSGRGQPPSGLIWLHLARAIEGTSSSRFVWKTGDEGWSLTNRKSGESIQGVWNQ